MIRLLVVLAAVNLGGGFGEAEGSTVSLGSETMIVDLSVEVNVSAQSVVAHLSSTDDDSRIIPLIHRGGNEYGIRTELPRRDYVVVFEAIGDPGELSSATTLSSMGVQLTVAPAPGSTQADDGVSRETMRWGWLALALAAASLSALAFWVLGGRDQTATAPTAEE